MRTHPTLTAIVIIGNLRYERDFDWAENAYTPLYPSKSRMFPRVQEIPNVSYPDTQHVPKRVYENWANRIIIG